MPRFVVRAVQILRHPPSLFLAAAGATMALAMSGAVLAQSISTAAGTGTAGFSGDGGAASAAALRFPSGAAFDALGNMYFADTANHRVRRIAAGTSQISTVAGNGSMAFFGDGGVATSASLSFPAAVAVDLSGNIYIADTGNSRVRKVSPAGTITTVAGNGTVGYAGDSGPATSASLYYPTGIVVDAAGNIYISDTFNHRVRVVASLTGVISTVAGTGTAGFSGDTGPATSAMLHYPEGLAFNSAGTLFVADTFNHRIRSVGGTIGTIGGNGIAGHVGDGGSATAASLKLPVSVGFDPGGNLYLVDYGNHRIRVIPSTGGMISAFAGAGSAGSAGDGGPPMLATFNAPRGVASDSAGSIHVSDAANHKIRKIGVQTAGSINVVALNVVRTGTGAAAGTVSSTNTGIACGETCFEILPVGTVVTMNASATGGATFSGWSGACTGTGTCTVTLDAAKSVTAIFDGAPSVVRLVNVSTRGSVQTGDNVMIGGFAISGSSSKTVLILARGPSLADAGVPNGLPNPRVTLVNQATGLIVESNDDWGTASNAAAISATGRAPTRAVESAILATLAPGNYTAVVDGGASLGTGNGIVEVYEIDRPETPIVNISTRGHVLTGDSVMIGGFAISGEGPQQVLILARGPSLADAGVPNTLPNPRVTLVNQATGLIVESNDDWGTATNAAAITATGRAPSRPMESAILITLNPGNYTAVVDGGASLGTGNAIIEVFRQ